MTSTPGPFAPERRRRDVVLLAATVAASLAAGLVVLGIQQQRRAERVRALDAPPGFGAGDGRATAAAETEADLDGDGQRELYTFLVWTQGSGQSWIGLRSTLSSGPTRTGWVPAAPDVTPDPRLAGETDLDKDGRAEAWVSLQEGDRRRYLMFRLGGDVFHAVRPGLDLYTESTPTGSTGWGCYDDGRVYLGMLSHTSGESRGIVRYFRLREGRFVPDGGATHTVMVGDPLPREYRPFPGCAGVAAPRTRPVPAAAAPPRSRPAPPPAEGVRRGDVDGDGRADRVWIVRDRVRTAYGREQRFGVRAVLSSVGTRTYWHPPGDGSNDWQSVVGFADVNGDGRQEVGVALGTSVASGYYELVTFAGGRLVGLRGSFHEAGLSDGEHGWGCAGGRVYDSVFRRTGATYRGTVRWSRMAGTRLVREETRTDTWRRGERRPREYGARIRCGRISRH